MEKSIENKFSSMSDDDLDFKTNHFKSLKKKLRKDIEDIDSEMIGLSIEIIKRKEILRIKELSTINE